MKVKVKLNLPSLILKGLNVDSEELILDVEASKLSGVERTLLGERVNDSIISGFLKTAQATISGNLDVVNNSGPITVYSIAYSLRGLNKIGNKHVFSRVLRIDPITLQQEDLEAAFKLALRTDEEDRLANATVLPWQQVSRAS